MQYPPQSQLAISVKLIWIWRKSFLYELILWFCMYDTTMIYHQNPIKKILQDLAKTFQDLASWQEICSKSMPTFRTCKNLSYLARFLFKIHAKILYCLISGQILARSWKDLAKILFKILARFFHREPACGLTLSAIGIPHLNNIIAQLQVHKHTHTHACTYTWYMYNFLQEVHESSDKWQYHQK